MSAMIGAFPSLGGTLCRAQASADLTDDDHDIAFSGWEVVEAHKVIEWAMKTYPKLNNGATLSIDWFPKVRRSANRTRARFANETRARNFEQVAEESPPEGDHEGLTAAEAAMEIGISVQYCRRIRHKIGGFRMVGRSIIFEPQAVADYKLRHPRSKRSSSAHDPDTPATQRPL